MPEGFPRYGLLAEFLHRKLSILESLQDQQLTPITFSKSLLEYVLMTFTATS